MSGLVLQLVKMSLTASIVILVVLLFRQLMKRFPKKYLYFMWMVVWFRALCPVSFGSKFSIFNIKRAADKASEAQITATAASAGRAAMRRRALAMAYRRLATAPAAHHPSTEVPSAAGKLDPQVIMLSIWLAVAVLILGYALFHMISLKVKLRDARKVDRHIYASPLVESPFVIGIFRPVIYIPTELGEDEAEYLIEHERAHIRRGDLIFKLLAVIAVAIHWFNPLVWLSFILFCRDMEMGCDEIVLERLGVGIRKDYSRSLVTMAKKNDDHSYVVMPVAFVKSPAGISEVKMRIDNILNFKKSSALVAAVAGVTVLGVGLTCGLNAYADETEETGESLEAQETVVEETVVEETVVEEEVSAPVEETAPAATGDLAASQELYMTARPPMYDCDYSGFTYDDYCIEDMSVFEDEQTRAMAQSYFDQGFFIDNPAIIQLEGSAPGDENMMFTNGFVAHSGSPCDAYVYWDLQVYKMDETLFDYYFIDMNNWDCNYYLEDFSFEEITDDGTTIRAVHQYENFEYRVEFDRSTGYATISNVKLYYSEEDLEVYAGPADLTDDLSAISNDALRAEAETLVSEGYRVYEGCCDYAGSYLDDGSHSYGFNAYYEDESYWCSIEACEMNDELFDAIFEDDDFYTFTDNGDEVIASYTYDDGSVEQYVYNRDSGIMVWSFEYYY